MPDLTLRELWSMAHGKRRMQRRLLVELASLFSIESMSGDQVEEYIRCGVVDGEHATDVLPYDEEAIKRIAESGLFRG